MNGTRREALKFITGAAGVAVLAPLLCGAQDPSQQNPSKTNASGDTNEDPALESKRVKNALEQNQKDIKKNIERLFQLAAELKDEVEKTDATTTLSLVMLRKTEEIEKLARQIREKAKG
ncbi:MAG: hypothetical protein JSS69_08810 [Acidobacteria bacterium]|nr:hypothetical protein [Acidobacteriota bacterium]MBS1866005.1 hypothetical protein [Acidobacteriota bacterium]